MCDFLKQNGIPIPECVTKSGTCGFVWVLRQNKAENRLGTSSPDRVNTDGNTYKERILVKHK